MGKKLFSKQSPKCANCLHGSCIDGEDAVVKRVIFDGNAIELQSLNTMYAPRRFEGKDANRVAVLGVVKKIIKEV